MVNSPSLAVYYDERCLDHEIPQGLFEYPRDDRVPVAEPHPDRPERLVNIKGMLESELDDHIEWNDITPATRNQLELVHETTYLDELENACASGGGRLTPSTAVCEETYDVCLYAAGGAIGATESALDGDVGYALVRPSGHHAQPAQWDGYCFVNNAAVAAEYAREQDGLESVAILDWDVHPGNGTQECFYDRDDVLVVSLHNDYGSWDLDSHPQTGSVQETGVDTGRGYTVNVPLPPGTGNKGYAIAFDRLVEPIVNEFAPDLVIASAAGDAGCIDPNGRNLLTMEGFTDLGVRTRELTDRADAALVFVQEGGYQISHLPFAVLGTISGAIGADIEISDPFAILEEYVPAVEAWVEDAVDAHKVYWEIE